MSKKKIVVVMNCQGLELIRYLKSNLSLACQYDFVYVTNIVLNDDEAAKRETLLALSTAHVVISQNVSSVAWLQNDHIAACIPAHCRFIRLCFWRFYGYWPVAAEKFHPQMWYVCDEVPGAGLRDYLGTSVSAADIERTFAQQVEKFAAIEAQSELKMLPFLLENYRASKLFTDEWHPTSVFFREVADYVASELGFPGAIDLLPDDGADNHRHRLVFEDVTRTLKLEYDQNLVQYYKTIADREVLFEYLTFARRCYDRAQMWTDPAGSFQEWYNARGLAPDAYDVSRFGAVADWAALPGEPGGGAAWSMDLRDFRKVATIDIAVADRPFAAGASLSLSSSVDGRAWTPLTTIRAFDAVNELGGSLTLDFETPVFARHLRLEARGTGEAAFGAVAVSTRALSL